MIQPMVLVNKTRHEELSLAIPDQEGLYRFRLLENLNSPPIIKIMRDYVPQLFPELELFYRAEKRKEGFLYDLENAVSIRNNIVAQGRISQQHVGKSK